MSDEDEYEKTDDEEEDVGRKEGSEGDDGASLVESLDEASEGRDEATRTSAMVVAKSQKTSTVCNSPECVMLCWNN